MSHQQPSPISSALQLALMQNELAAVARFLARLWLSELDAEVLRDFAADDLRDAYLRVGGAVPAEDEATLDELAADYCQLFIGPVGHLLPYQSVWQEDQLQGRAAQSTTRFRELVGNSYVTPPRNTPADHLGVQLDIWSWLVEFSRFHGEADRDGTAEGDSLAHQWHEIAEEFGRRHLAWPAALLGAVRAQAQTSFYRQLAVVTANYLDLFLPRLTGGAINLSSGMMGDSQPDNSSGRTP